MAESINANRFTDTELEQYFQELVDKMETTAPSDSQINNHEFDEFWNMFREYLNLEAIKNGESHLDS